ncbi:MAG: aspartate/glutamate racemase family protein [Sedimentisphaerales bacterium]|nr:aspartate/glutamate racemase family protein [Sedimentisphaerales bacterium]
MGILKKIKHRVFTLVILVVISAIAGQTNSQDRELEIVETILKDKSSFFYIDAENYPRPNRRLPIGVFDSGTGGLTVFDAIINLDQYDNKNHRFRNGGDGLRDFDEEYFIYLGDQANMPYGNYPRQNKADLLREHVIKDAQFLLANKYYPDGNASRYKTDKQPVKVIVIACNTATAYGKEEIRRFMDRAGLEIKVIGVIDAGVRAALALFGADESGSVAVMATAATVGSGGYVKTLDAQKKAMNYTGNIAVFQQGGIGLAGAIDGSDEYIDSGATLPRKEYRGPSGAGEKVVVTGEKHSDAMIDLTILPRYGFVWGKNEMLFNGKAGSPKNLQINSVKNYISYHVVSLMEKIRKKPGAGKLKAIILGCTHYPFYMEIFQKKLEELYGYREKGEYLYRPFMARNIVLIDPALNTAKELYRCLASSDLFNDESLNRSEFYVSVPNQSNHRIQVNSSGGFTYNYKYGRDEGFIQEYVKRVPFSKNTIAPEVLRRLSQKVPLVFNLIANFNRNNSKTAFLRQDEKIDFPNQNAGKPRK